LKAIDQTASLVGLENSRDNRYHASDSLDHPPPCGE